MLTYREPFIFFGNNSRAFSPKKYKCVYIWYWMKEEKRVGRKKWAIFFHATFFALFYLMSFFRQMFLSDAGIIRMERYWPGFPLNLSKVVGKWQEKNIRQVFSSPLTYLAVESTFTIKEKTNGFRTTFIFKVCIQFFCRMAIIYFFVGKCNNLLFKRNNSIWCSTYTITLFSIKGIFHQCIFFPGASWYKRVALCRNFLVLGGGKIAIKNSQLIEHSNTYSSSNAQLCHIQHVHVFPSPESFYWLENANATGV